MKTKHLEIFLIAGMILIAFVLRIAYLEAPSIWVDEVTSRYRAQIALFQMMRELGFDQMPLYYLFLEIWVKLCGLSVFSLRMPSVLWGTLVIPQVYILGKRLYNNETGVISACIAGISPFLIYYSRMARAYPFLWFLVLLAFNSYLHAIQVKTWGAWLWYAIVAAGAAYTHFTALPILSFLGLHALLQWKQLKPQLHKWIAAHLLFLLAFTPFISRLFSMVFNHTSSVISRGQLSLWYLADIFVSWNLGHTFGTTKLTFLLSVLSFGFVTVLGVFSSPLRWNTIKLHLCSGPTLFLVLPRLHWSSPEIFLIGCSLSLSVLAVFAKLISPDNLSFSPRNFSVAALPYYILLARGLQRLRPSVIRYTALVGGVSIMLISIGISINQGAGVDWRWAAQHIQDHEGPNDLVLVLPAGQYLSALETYYEGEATLEQRSVQLVDELNVVDILSLVNDYEQVWLITINDALFDPQDLIGSWLSAHCVFREEEVLIPKHARMRLYEECTLGQ